MNKFIGSGRLAKEPDVRYTQSGKCVYTFTLAMTEGWGENRKSTFLPVIEKKDVRIPTPGSRT